MGFMLCAVASQPHLSSFFLCFYVLLTTKSTNILTWQIDTCTLTLDLLIVSTYSIKVIGSKNMHYKDLKFELDCLFVNNWPPVINQ